MTEGAIHWPQPAGDLFLGIGQPGTLATISYADLSLVHDLVVPLRRILLILGHDATALYFRYTGSGDEWAHIDLVTLNSGSSHDSSEPPVAEGLPWNGPTIALALRPIHDAQTSRSMAMSLPNGSEWYLSGSYLYVGYDDPLIAELDSLVTSTLDSAIGAFVGAAAAAAAERFGPDLLSDADEPCGLLWLLHFPGWWQDTAEPTLDTSLIRKIGITAHAGIGAQQDIRGFFEDQATGKANHGPTPLRGDPSPAHNLTKVLGEPLGKLALLEAQTFFKHVDGWLRARNETHLLPDSAQELAALPWFEVLVTLVERSVFRPAALAGSAEQVEPVQARRIDRYTVKLTVWGRYEIMLVLDDVDGSPPSDELPDGMSEAQALLTPIPDFTWDYLDASDEPDSLPTLYIVAARGVLIIQPSEAPSGWRVEIIRVENRSLVPAWGSGLDIGLLLSKSSITYGDRIAEFSEEWFEVEHAGPLALKAVAVYRQPHGIILQYPGFDDGSGAVDGSSTVLLVVSIKYTDPTSSTDRFAYDVWFYRDSREEDPVPYISVWATKGIEVTVYKRLGMFDLLYDPRLAVTVWDVPFVGDIPPLGQPLPFDTVDIRATEPEPGEEPSLDDSKFEDYATAWEPVWDDGDVPRRRGFTQRLGLSVTDWREPVFFLADIGLGFIPFVGDAIDIVELAKMVVFGTDKWGRPVSNADILITGGAVLIPFASAALIEHGLKRALVAFSSNAYPTLPLRIVDAEVVESTTVEALEAEIEAHAKKATEWTSLSRKQRLDVLDALKKLVEPLSKSVGDQLTSEFFQLADITDDVGQGFRIPEVEGDYQKWIAELRYSSGGARPVLVTPEDHERAMRDFIAECRNRRTRVILQTLLGNDVVGRIGLGMRKPKSKANYPSSDRVVLRSNPPPQSTLVRDFDQVIGGVTRIVDRLRSAPGPEATHGWPIQIFDGHTAHSSVVRKGSATYVEWTNRLIQKLQGTDPTFNNAHLRKLVGTKQLHPEELAELLVLSFDLLEHEAARMGRSVDEVLEVTGIEDFFRNVITGKGKENGARFEVLIAADEAGNTDAGEVLVMGAKLPGITDPRLREGPDFLRYHATTDEGADIIQGKSYADPDVLTEPITNEIPIVLQQLWSDLMRLKNVDPPFTFDPPPGGTDRVPFSGRVKFSIDLAHAYNSQRKLGKRKGIERLHEEMLENAEGAADQFSAYLNSHRAELGLPDDLEIELIIEVLG